MQFTIYNEQCTIIVLSSRHRFFTSSQYKHKQNQKTLAHCPKQKLNNHFNIRTPGVVQTCHGASQQKKSTFQQKNHSEIRNPKSEIKKKSYLCTAIERNCYGIFFVFHQGKERDARQGPVQNQREYFLENLQGCVRQVACRRRRARQP